MYAPAPPILNTPTEMTEKTMANENDRDAHHDGSNGEPRGSFNGLEVIAAILLGLAGILTAYAAFQGALQDGNSLDKYTLSAKLTSDANGYYSDGKQQFGQDLALFTQFQILVETGDEATAQVLSDNFFSPELKTAYEAWFALGDESPPTPLDTEEYVLQDYVEGDLLTDEADAAFAEAQKANEDGDTFELATVFFAVALFLAGIASLLKARAVQMAMLIASVTLIAPGVYAILDGKGWI